MRRFKELSGSRERRCLETLEDREREMGELRATVHSKEKDAEDATHKFNACELKLSGHHEEKKLSGGRKVTVEGTVGEFEARKRKFGHRDEQVERRG